MLQTRDLIVIDVETTGHSAFVHDLLSVALVPVDDPADALLVHVRPEAPVWTDFARRNFERFKEEWSRDVIPAEAALEIIQSYLRRRVGAGKAKLVGHNVGFDISFLNKLAFTCGRVEFEGVSHRVVDTHTLLYLGRLLGRLDDSVLTSDGAFRAFNIAIPESARHTAMADALATRDLFIRLVELLGERTLHSESLVFGRIG